MEEKSPFIVTSASFSYACWFCKWTNIYLRQPTIQKMKFSIKGFISKCDQIRRKLRIWSHLLKKSLMENFIFCAVTALIVISASVSVILDLNYLRLQSLTSATLLWLNWNRVGDQVNQTHQIEKQTKINSQQDQSKSWNWIRFNIGWHDHAKLGFTNLTCS